MGHIKRFCTRLQSSMQQCTCFMIHVLVATPLVQPARVGVSHLEVEVSQLDAFLKKEDRLVGLTIIIMHFLIGLR